MTTDGSRRTSIGAVAAVTAVGAFVAELLTPRAVSVHMFYVLPIVLTWFIPSRRSTIVTATAAVVLTVLGLWTAPGTLSGAVIADHIMALALFVAVAALVTRSKQLTAERAAVEAALVVARDELEARVAARTLEIGQRADQLRRLASDLTLAERRARDMLAKTLHDGLQQQLFGTRLQVEHIARSAGKGTPPGREALERLAANLDEAIAATRALSVELSPPVPRDAGLSAALRWLAVQAQERYGLAVELSLDPSANPENDDVRVLVFESVRELLFNVVKHAKIREATLAMSPHGDGQFAVTVADRGAGLDVSAVSNAVHTSQGLGLFSIRERLQLLGGRLDIDSAPGRGARFTLIAPRRDLSSAASRRVDSPGAVVEG